MSCGEIESILCFPSAVLLIVSSPSGPSLWVRRPQGKHGSDHTPVLDLTPCRVPHKRVGGVSHRRGSPTSAGQRSPTSMEQKDLLLQNKASVGREIYHITNPYFIKHDTLDYFEFNIFRPILGCAPSTTSHRASYSRPRHHHRRSSPSSLLPLPPTSQFQTSASAAITSTSNLQPSPSTPVTQVCPLYLLTLGCPT